MSAARPSLVIVLLLVFLGWVDAARGCSGGVLGIIKGERPRELNVRELIDAIEPQIARGAYQIALATIQSATGQDAGKLELQWLQVDAEQRGRLARLLAMALTQTGRGAEALPLLHELLREAPQDPFLLVRRAEALAQSAATFRLAYAQLEDYASRGLIVDSRGYAALAMLRAVVGNPRGQREALAKCAALAARPGLCVPAVPVQLRRYTDFVWASLYVPRENYGALGLSWVPKLQAELETPVAALYAPDFVGRHLFPLTPRRFDRTGWSHEVARLRQESVVSRFGDIDVTLADQHRPDSICWDVSYNLLWGDRRHPVLRRHGQRLCQEREAFVVAREELALVPDYPGLVVDKFRPIAFSLGVAVRFSRSDGSLRGGRADSKGTYSCNGEKFLFLSYYLPKLLEKLETAERLGRTVRIAYEREGVRCHLTDVSVPSLESGFGPDHIGLGEP